MIWTQHPKYFDQRLDPGRWARVLQNEFERPDLPRTRRRMAAVKYNSLMKPVDSIKLASQGLRVLTNSRHW